MIPDLPSFLGPLLRASLGARPKRHRRAASYFGRTGGGSFWNANTLLAALGLGVGAYEVWRTRQGQGGAGTAPIPRDAPANRTWVADEAAPAAPPPPPLSAGAAGAPAPGLPEGAQRVVRLMLAAARADGELGEQEHARIRDEARALGLEELVESERRSPRALGEIVAGVRDPEEQRELYALAYGLVRADESVTGAERIWLARLATTLALDRATVERIEKDTDAGIDASRG